MAVPIMRKTATKPEVKDVIQISFEIENEATIKEIDVPEIIICPEYTLEFEVMESYPNPAGGMIGWKQYLSMNLRYPTQARRLGIEGSVILAFIVNIEGNLEDIEVLGDIGGGCAEEAVRVVSDSPRWEPGKQRGRPVRTRMRLPIKFKLDRIKKDSKLESFFIFYCCFFLLHSKTWSSKDQRTFIACSLIFSNSSFIKITYCCTNASLALEPIVLISLPISCEMNPSFLP